MRLDFSSIRHLPFNMWHTPSIYTQRQFETEIDKQFFRGAHFNYAPSFGYQSDLMIAAKAERNGWQNQQNIMCKNCNEECSEQKYQIQNLIYKRKWCTSGDREQRQRCERNQIISSIGVHHTNVLSIDWVEHFLINICKFPIENVTDLLRAFPGHVKFVGDLGKCMMNLKTPDLNLIEIFIDNIEAYKRFASNMCFEHSLEPWNLEVQDFRMKLMMKTHVPLGVDMKLLFMDLVNVECESQMNDSDASDDDDTFGLEQTYEDDEIERCAYRIKNMHTDFGFLEFLQFPWKRYSRKTHPIPIYRSLSAIKTKYITVYCHIASRYLVLETGYPNNAPTLRNLCLFVLYRHLPFKSR